MLHGEPWSTAVIRVRMGIHKGIAHAQNDPREEPYSGYATLSLTQRIMSVGYGGQILFSQSTYELTRDRLPENVQLLDLGEHRLKDIVRPERIYQLRDSLNRACEGSEEEVGLLMTSLNA
jgi:class 3 adenylate cyclase